LLGATVAFLLSALSKESGLLFPLVAMVIAVTLRDKKALIKTIIVSSIVAAAYFSLRQAAEHNPSPAPAHPEALATRPILVARAFAEYAGLIALPVNLHMDREVDAQPGASAEANMNSSARREIQTLLGITLMGGMLYWILRARRRNAPVAKLLLLAALTYLPVSGIVALNAPVAEHWIYVPTAFLFLAAGLGVAPLLEKRGPRLALVRALSVALACWMAFLTVRTGFRTLDWKDQRTFLERTIATGGDSARMLINLGGLELSEGHLDRARAILGSVLKKEPDQPLAIINLAAVAVRQNDFKTARQLALRATQMPWVDAQAHELIAVLDNKEKGHADPLRLRLAARTGPPNWSIEKRYVRFLDEIGATDAAIRELQTCLRTQWYRAESWQLLGQLLTKTGLPNDAAIARRQAVAYDVHLTEHPTVL
jgi:tetratricopeptide (TPR) repeat protein